MISFFERARENAGEGCGRGWGLDEDGAGGQDEKLSNNASESLGA